MLRLSLLLLLPLLPPPTGVPGAIKLIKSGDVRSTIEQLAHPGLEGRDTPSEGLDRANEIVGQRLLDLGFQPVPGSEPSGDEDRSVAVSPADLHIPFDVRRSAPVLNQCGLSLLRGGEEDRVYGPDDFVPIAGCNGSEEAELVFAGFGIKSSKYKYNDLKGLKLKDKVALIFSGEPRHKRKFDGEEVTREASLRVKLDNLADAGAIGALVIRRTPVGGEEDLGNLLDFRYTHAQFVGVREPRLGRRDGPVLEISMACATELLGRDAESLAASMDRSGRPKRVDLKRRRVKLRTKTETRQVVAHNVCAMLPGSDPELAQEYVVLGAHLDHIGVDLRGRVGCGADDNASGVAAVLEVAEALASNPPPRSIICCLFSGEEDGLLGSAALCRDLFVPPGQVVAMLNLDMIGRGRTDEVAVLGIRQNPGLEQLLERAQDLHPTGVKSMVLRKGEDLFRRSDHYSFHRLGIPTLFFFEGLPISQNPDYHTWRDVPELVDMEKVTRTARLVFNTAWILANDKARPAAPR